MLLLRNGQSHPPAPAGEEIALEPARETNDQIANNLALIAGLVRLQIEQAERFPEMIQAGELRALTVGLSAHIDAVARLHPDLPLAPANGTFDACPLIRGIFAELSSAYSSSGQWTFASNFSCSSILCTTQIVSISIIITELVTNAVKYAHPSGVNGTINLDVRTGSDGDLVIEVSDDGVGLPEGFNWQASPTLGLKIVRTLAADLNARLAIESDALGTIARLHVPLPPLHAVSNT
jgi:two-component sensor histidine kinase